MRLVLEVIAALTGEVVGVGIDPLLARAYKELKRRLQLWHVFVVWVFVPLVMVLAWQLGLASGMAWFRWLTGIVFVLAPTPALVITVAWRERRDV